MANAPPGTFDTSPYAVGTPPPDPGFSSSGIATAGAFTGSAPPATATSDAAALFDALLEFSWRGISFPTSAFHVRLRQDLAIHKFADRDGAHVEGTGRAPLEISARIPMINGLAAGSNEHWQRPLYPYTWRQFFAACADKSSGVLQHPELGPLTCKLETLDTGWDANVRGGVWCDAVWVESDDTGVDLDEDLSQPSPLADLSGSAGDMDTAVANADPLIAPSLPTFPYSFSDLADAIGSVADTETFLSKEAGGRIENVLYQAHAVASVLQRPDVSPLNWPMWDAAQTMMSAANDLQNTLLSKSKTVGLYTTVLDQPLWMVAQSIPAPLLDVVNLNPSLAATPIVQANTVVRYYLASA